MPFLSRQTLQIQKNPRNRSDYGDFKSGAGEGTRTPTVSLLILSQARLPFRHPAMPRRIASDPTAGEKLAARPTFGKPYLRSKSNRVHSALAIASKK